MSECDLDKLHDLHDEFSFVARSAMSDRLQTVFLRGRPFGGLALLIRKSLFAKIKLVGVDSKCRCLTVIITLHNGVKLLVTNVYFPCSVSGMEYESAVLDCIGFIDNALVEHKYDKVILLSDFNFECKEQCSGYRILRNLFLEYNLQCCEECADSEITYTYFQDTLHRFFVIDHMFVDNSMCCNIIMYCITDSGVNFSDHLPVSCVIAVENHARSDSTAKCMFDKACSKAKCDVLRWDKGDLELYYSCTVNGCKI